MTPLVQEFFANINKNKIPKINAFKDDHALIMLLQNLICQYKKSRKTDPLTIKNAEKDIHLKKFHCCYKNGMCLFVILKWP